MKTVLKIVVGCVLAFIVFPNEIKAQSSMEEFIISGNVVEANTETPMEYVTVGLLSNRDSAIVSGTITDKDGNFIIKIKRPGKYFLSLDFIGFEKKVISNVILKPESGMVNLGKLFLQPTRLGIDEVEVTAEKPYVSYKLDRKVVDVSRNPSAQGGTAVDALENVPSIDIDIEGNVLVRGSSSFTVLIDGRQSPLTGSDALSQIPASAIDQIEIITNPSAKYDPDGTAGIINVITKKGKLNGHSMVANASIGSSPQSSADVTYAYRANKYTFTGSAGFRDSQMQFRNRDDRETNEFDTLGTKIGESFIFSDQNGVMERDNYFFKGAIDYHLSDANTFSIGGSYNNYTFARSFNSQIETSFEDNMNITLLEGYELSTTNFEVNPQSWQVNLGDKQIFKENKDHYLTADLIYQWGNKEAIDLVSKNASNLDWEKINSLQPEEQAITNEDSKSLRLEINYALPISDNLSFETGYTLRSDSYEQDYRREIRDSSASNWLPNSIYDDAADFNRNIHAGWAVVKGEVFGLQYSAGLRLENTDRKITTEKENWDFNYNYLGWYPSLSIAKEWGSGHTLQTSYSKRINRPRDYHLNPFPHLSDGYTQYKPNPELLPEYAHSAELNYQKAWGQSFVAVETFYRYTENEIDRITEVSGDTLIRTMINLGSESDLGGELAVNLKIAKWWTFNPMTTISYNRAEGTYANNYTTVSGMDYRASVTNNFFLSKTRLQLMSYYRGARKDIDGTREPSYWVSAAIRQDFFDRQLSATLRIDDIFQTRKRESNTYTETTKLTSIGQRKSPTVVFSLSYKLNPGNDKKKNGNENGNGGEMEMDF